MAAQPPDPEIEQLLAELRSGDADRRKAAAEKIAERKITSVDIVEALRAITRADHFVVRQAAEQALASLGVMAPPAPAKPVEPLSRRAKIQDFTVGFVGWFLINGLAWFTLSGGGANIGGASFWGILLFPLNLVVLLVLAFSRRWVARRWVALGMLSAIALNLLVALIMGVQIAAWCFIPFFTPGLR